uniref:Uncharacterized protein n=1 Tax=Moniliophthora roreri TaxID=221103 RepID=A0A0W0G0L2_MONRR
MPQTVGTGTDAIAPDLEVVKEWKTSNTQALGLFQLKLSSTLQWIIKDTAKETWDALRAEYDVSSLPEMFTYFKGLVMACTAEGQNPDHSANLIRQCVAKLSENNFPILSNFQAMFLLNSLPKSYEGVKTQMFVSNKGKDLTFDNILPFIKQEYNRRHMDGVAAYAAQISGVQQYTRKSLNWNRQKKFRPCNPNPNSGNNQNQNSGSQENKGKQPVQPQQNQQKSDGKKNKKKLNKKGKGKKPNGAISFMMAEITDLPQKEEHQPSKEEISSDNGKVPTKCVNHFCTSPDKTIYSIFITGQNHKTWYICEQCYKMHSQSFAKQKILQKAVLVCLPIDEKAYAFLHGNFQVGQTFGIVQTDKIPPKTPPITQKEVNIGDIFPSESFEHIFGNLPSGKHLMTHKYSNQIQEQTTSQIRPWSCPKEMVTIHGS